MIPITVELQVSYYNMTTYNDKISFIRRMGTNWAAVGLTVGTTIGAQLYGGRNRLKFPQYGFKIKIGKTKRISISSESLLFFKSKFLP